LNKGTPQQRKQARWYRLWSYALSRDFTHAKEEVSALLAQTRDGKERRMLRYWLARLHHKAGQTATAKSLYQEIARELPSDYYGLLARQRLRSGGLNPRTLIDPDLLDSVPEATGPVLPDEPDITGIPANDPLFTAILLSRVGLDEYAYDESLASRLAAGSYNLMLCFQDGANCVKGYTVYKAALNGGLEGANELAAYRLGYPRAFQKYIGTYATIWSVDEMLPYAVMRQESTFKPLALSSAYAYGLMQIIPPTADQIAAQIAYPDFHIGLLNTPRINTLLGTYYLSYLADKLQGKLIHVIAAYNAGPNAVSRWKGKSQGLEDDEFVELIPYQETKDYVKKVLLNYLIYKKIY
jgi:soluble lytic murein transglycosylase